MVLALMSPTAKGVLWLIAVILFVIAALLGSVASPEGGHPVLRVNLVALGLAFFVFPFMYDAFASA